MISNADILKNWFIGREGSKYIAQHETDMDRPPVYAYSHQEIMAKLKEIEEDDDNNRSSEV